MAYLNFKKSIQYLRSFKGKNIRAMIRADKFLNRVLSRKLVVLFWLIELAYTNKHPLNQ
jgi:hypothetical protein